MRHLNEEREKTNFGFFKYKNKPFRRLLTQNTCYINDRVCHGSNQFNQLRSHCRSIELLANAKNKTSNTAKKIHTVSKNETFIAQLSTPNISQRRKKNCQNRSFGN